MSSSSSDNHQHHKKRKHQRRHHSRDSTATLLQSICDEMQSISNRVAVIEKATTTDASQAVQSAASSLTEPTVAGEQRPPTLPGHAADHSGEEQSISTMPAAQLADDNSPGAWGDQDELELPDYNETVYWEPDPDSEDGESEVQKL